MIGMWMRDHGRQIDAAHPIGAQEWGHDAAPGIGAARRDRATSIDDHRLAARRMNDDAVALPHIRKFDGEVAVVTHEARDNGAGNNEHGDDTELERALVQRDE